MAIGAQKSTLPSVCRPLNAPGRTPTIVNVWPLRLTVLPTTCGSDANARFHRPVLITITGDPPSVVSSPGVIVRPSAARTPSTSK